MDKKNKQAFRPKVFGGEQNGNEKILLKSTISKDVLKYLQMKKSLAKKFVKDKSGESIVALSATPTTKDDFVKRDNGDYYTAVSDVLFYDDSINQCTVTKLLMLMKKDSFIGLMMGDISFDKSGKAILTDENKWLVDFNQFCYLQDSNSNTIKTKMQFDESFGIYSRKNNGVLDVSKGLVTGDAGFYVRDGILYSNNTAVTTRETSYLVNEQGKVVPDKLFIYQKSADDPNGEFVLIDNDSYMKSKIGFV